jgi:hypothetical protein
MALGEIELVADHQEKSFYVLTIAKDAKETHEHGNLHMFTKLQNKIQKLRNKFRPTQVDAVTYLDGCYDELDTRVTRVHVVYPGVSSLVLNAIFTTDVYDAVKYMLFTHYQGETIEQILSIAKRVHVYARGHLLRRTQLPLSLYGVGPDEILTVRVYGLVGGSDEPSSDYMVPEKVLLPTYAHVAECEREVLRVLVPQSGDDSATGAYMRGCAVFSKAA